MEPIKDTVKNVIRKWEAKRKGSRRCNPQALLKRIFTKKELDHVKFNYFKGRTLNINVDSSSWLYHLNLKKDKLLAKLGKDSSATINDIRFFVGEISEKEKSKAP